MFRKMAKQWGLNCIPTVRFVFWSLHPFLPGLSETKALLDLVLFVRFRAILERRTQQDKTVTVVGICMSLQRINYRPFRKTSDNLESGVRLIPGFSHRRGPYVHPRR